MSDQRAPQTGGFIANWSGLAAGLVGALIGIGGILLVQSQGLLDPHRASTERIVREYLLANPQILREVSERLHDSELAQAVGENRKALETPFGNAWAGAEKGDVVLVEFFDYACPYCHKSVADIERLLGEDKNLKVVWREWPVLGDDSVAAAEASLAAAHQGKFREFYKTLYTNGRPTPEAVAAAGKTSGLAAEAEHPDYRGEIERNYELARAIGASGTPVFVVGDKVLQGAVGYDALKAAIAEARKKG